MVQMSSTFNTPLGEEYNCKRLTLTVDTVYMHHHADFSTSINGSLSE